MRPKKWHQRHQVLTIVLVVVGTFVVLGVIGSITGEEDRPKTMTEITTGESATATETADELWSAMPANVQSNFCLDDAIGDGSAYAKFKRLFYRNSYGVSETYIRDVYDALAAKCY